MKLSSEIEKSFPKIEKLFNEKMIKEFINCDYEKLNIYHFSLGIWIRNNILQKNSGLRQMFVQAGVTHLDDMSIIIIKQFYIYMINKHKTKTDSTYSHSI